MRVRQRAHALRVIWAPSLARRLARHRGVQAIVVIAAAATLALSLTAKSEALDEQRSSWGAVQTVLVVVERVEPGELVVGSVEVREMPAAVVPAAAVGAVAAASRAKATLFPGEMVMRERITGAADQASTVPDGTVALTVPIVRLVPFLAGGDLVDLWTVDSANFSSQRVAANVVVLAFSDEEITIAVPTESVSDLTATSLRPLTITLVG